MSRLLYSTIHQVMLYFWLFIGNPFSLLWSFFFLKKLCFLWSPCLLLIAELISLDTSGKCTLEFFFKTASPSWIICQSHLMNFIQLIDYWRAVGELFEVIFILLLQKNYNMAKNIWGFLENLFEYYLWNIIVNVNFFSDLKFEYFCEYYPEILLQVSLK